eukprot:scaffold315607_cov39-Tisochrysis_lutea.AAC.1
MAMGIIKLEFGISWGREGEGEGCPASRTYTIRMGVLVLMPRKQPNMKHEVAGCAASHHVHGRLIFATTLL